MLHPLRAIRNRHLGPVLLAWSVAAVLGWWSFRHRERQGFLDELVLLFVGAALVWAIRETLLHLTPRGGDDRRRDERRRAARRQVE